MLDRRDDFDNPNTYARYLKTMIRRKGGQEMINWKDVNIVNRSIKRCSSNVDNS